MKTLAKDKIPASKGLLTAEEKEDMKLVKESIEHGVYNPPKSKEQTLRNATELALKRAVVNRNEQF